MGGTCAALAAVAEAANLPPTAGARAAAVTVAAAPAAASADALGAGEGASDDSAPAVSDDDAPATRGSRGESDDPWDGAKLTAIVSLLGWDASAAA